MQHVERVPLDELHEHPRNARKHDLAVITRSLAGLGQYRPIVVNCGTKTGRPNEILAGHGTVKAAAALGWPSIDAVLVDVDETTATNILLVDNRASDLAEYDDRLLVELLASLDDLTLTGYDPDDYDELVRGLSDIDERDLDEGDADTDQGERIFGIAIECQSEQQQAKLLERFTAEGLSVRALM
jgi:ParB-like chromosome segregation protein Spo0J